MGEVIPDSLQSFNVLDVEDLKDHRLAMEITVCSGFVGQPEEFSRIWRNYTQSIPHPERTLFKHSEHAEFVAWILPKIQNNDPMNAITLVQMATESQMISKLGGIHQILSYGKSFSQIGIEVAKQQLERLIDLWKRTEFETHVKFALESASKGNNLSNVIIDLLQSSKGLINVESKLFSTSEAIVEQAFKQITDPTETSHFIKSKFSTMGSMYGHYQRGQIFMIGAPTGNGKTAFVMMEIDYALENGLTVDAFLMESSFRQYMMRHIAQKQNIPISKFMNRILNKTEMERAIEEKNRMMQYENQIHFAPDNSLSALDIDALIQERKAKTGKKCDIIFVDHLNTMRPMTKGTGATDYQHYVDTMQELKDIASRENAALVLAAQLNTQTVRDNFDGPHKLPTLDSFRGGAPTEAAKVCVILHKNKQDMLDRDRPVVEQRMVVVKANDGETGVVDSLFVRPIAMHLEDSPPISHVTGKRMTLGHYRKLNHGEYLTKYGFDLERERGLDD